MVINELISSMSTVFGMKSGYNVIFYFHLYNKPRCFWRNLYRWQKFYTPAVSDVSDKFHLWLPLNSLGQGWKTQGKCTIFRAGFVTKIEEGRDDDWVDWKREKEIGQMMKENWTNLLSFNLVSYEVGKIILQRCPIPSMVKR